MILYIVLWVVALVLLLAIFLILKYRKTWKISEDWIKFFKKQIKQIDTPAISPRERILSFDKLYHHILKDLWYEWSFWEILKRKPKEISDIDQIWKLHKLRNKLAHDFDTIDERILIKRANEFKLEIEKMI